MKFWIRRGSFSFKLLILALAVTLWMPASAQNQEAAFAIHGTVLDSSGKPIQDAVVRVQQKESPDVAATTDSQGAFSITAARSGSCLISAEKSGLRSRVLNTSDMSSTDLSHLRLILEPAEAMDFSDKPNFTVAGITDWTAVGGHGSDSSLRTSEALARETASLKPDSGATNPVGKGIAREEEKKLRAALAASPKSFETNHQLGEFCLHAGSYRDAIPPLETAYRIDPANDSNEYDLAMAYKGAGDFSQAREHILKLLAHQNTAALHRALGDIDEASGDSVAAEHEYEQAAQLDPSEQNYFAWGSELLLHRAVWPAVEVFKRGSEAHPKSARLQAALGAALFAGALYAEAAQRLCDASDLNPADPTPYLMLGKIDAAAPDPLSCVEPKLARFMQAQPGDARAGYYYAMALWKQQRRAATPGKMEQVESLLKKAVTDDPEYAEAYLQLGNLYTAERRYDEAVNFYLKAIHANPQLGEAHYRLGVAFERTGESAKAKQEFQLHDEIEKQQAAAIEQQRQEVKQFLVVLQNKPAN